MMRLLSMLPLGCLLFILHAIVLKREGSKIISQMRSHILWMEKRRSRQHENASKGSSESSTASMDGAFIVAPCPHDGPCPLAKTRKYCHFVQHMERTESQLADKRSGSASLRGFEDEKFSYVAFRRGKRPQEPWPLDGLKFETLDELRAKRNPEDLEVDYDDQFEEESISLRRVKPIPFHIILMQRNLMPLLSMKRKRKESKQGMLISGAAGA